MCTYDRNDSQRPGISEPKQILDVISFVWHIMQTIYIFAYEVINQNKVMSGSTQHSKHKIFVLVPK